MVAVISKVIFGIPLWLTGLAGKGMAAGVKFLAELVGILGFKARWWVAAIFWLFVLWGLVKLEPIIKESAPHSIWAVYIRLVIVLMGLMLLAYITKNLRRRWRRAKLEIKVLNAVGDAKKHIIEVKDSRKGAGGSGLSLWQKFRRHAGRMQELPDTVTVIEDNLETDLDAFAAKVAADAQAEVDAMFSGESLNRKRESWNLGLDKKPKRSPSNPRPTRNRKSSVQSTTKSPKFNPKVGDNLEFEASFLGGVQGQHRVTGKIVRMVDDPVTGTPTPIVESGGYEYVVGTNTTIYRHW